MAVVLAALGLVLFAERQPYERYQSVVDRQMFGQPPPGFDPTKNPNEVSAKDAKAKEQELTKEQEQVKSAIHFSMVNVTPAGDTAVGFTDNSDSKNPRHYYLKVGESRDGWTVKEADPLAATMTIAKGDVEVSLTLGGNSASGAGTTRSASAGVSAANVASRRSAALASRSGTAAGGRGLGSLRERRALREQARAEEKAAAEERARVAAEKEAQREAEQAAEREQREREREEQRAQLMQIQEELKKAREERQRSKDDTGDGSSEEDGSKDEVRDEV